jgi:hypothetical protein
VRREQEVSGAVAAAALAFGLAGILLLFFGRQPVALLMKRRVKDGNFGADASALALGAGVMIVGGAAVFGLLILLAGYVWIMGLAAAGVVLFALHTLLSLKSRERAAGPEFAGILMLTLTAPLGFYLAGRSLSPEALWLWVLCFLYVGMSVWHVKAMLRAAAKGRRQEARSPAATRALAYLLFVVVSLIALALFGAVPVAAALGFVPAAVWVIWQALRPSHTKKVVREGIRQTAFSVWFVAVTALSYWNQP